MNTSLVFSKRDRSTLMAALELFPVQDGRRGQEYLRQGRVKSIEPLDHAPGFQAEVQGSQLYTVEWRTDGKTWFNECSCPLEADCKHAYAAAQCALANAADMDEPNTSAKSKNSTVAKADPPELIHLLAELQSHRGRPLSGKEKSIARELVRTWQRVRSGGALYPRDLRAVGIGESGYYFDEPRAVLAGWRDFLRAARSPLEFWQYLAFDAERQRIALPELMRSVTNTAAVRTEIEAAERQQAIEQWKKLLGRERESIAPIQPISGALPSEIRLKLTTPRLTWEFRENPGGSWQIARGPRVKIWFDLADSGEGESAAARLLLHETLARREIEGGWEDPATLRIQDPTTRGLLRWMVASSLTRSMLVNFRGESFEPEWENLHWQGRPTDDRDDDVRFDLVDSQGAEAPKDLIDLGGHPRLGVSETGKIIYRLPEPLAEGAPRGVIVPRESLDHKTTAALRRRGVRFEGVELPEIKMIPLRPRFACKLQDVFGEEVLGVELQALAEGERVVSRRQGHGWTRPAWPKTTRAENAVTEADFTAADGSVAFLAALNLGWSMEQMKWTRRISSKSFPEEFAEWVRAVRAAGIEILAQGDLAGLARASDAARVEVQAKPLGDEAGQIDWFDLEVAVRPEDHTLTPEEVKLLLKARGRFVRLPGKGWRRLQVALNAGEDTRLAELGVELDALTVDQTPHRFHALQLIDERIAGLLPEAQAARVRERAESLRAIPAPLVPLALQTELRPYQKEGYHFLAHLSANGLGGILADDMGLGKTVQAIAWLLWLAEQVRASKSRELRVLVVCPKSVVSNWQLEIARFAPALTTETLVNRKPGGEAHVTVGNYAQLRLSTASLRGQEWDAVILDEGQNIKNPQSQTARVARDLRAGHRLILTGTPIENRALDLWSLFAFAMPGLLGSQASFKRSYGDRADALARARLGRRVRHFLLRRTKAQVAADLPPRIEEDLLVDLDGEQRKLYDAELKRARSMLLGVHSDAQFNRERFNILQSLLRLRQICCDPRLLGIDSSTTRKTADENGTDETTMPGGKEKERGTASSAKMEALFDTLEPLIAEGHRVLVFSQFVALLSLVATEMKAREIPFLLITGQTENRQTLVDRFQSPEGEPVFLLSLKAAGAGLNLTAASYVVLFDPWWNPAVEAQAIDRTHRIGQTNPVIAYRLLARGTIEEKIRLLQRSKSELARTIVQEENVATVMSIDDLRFVLSE